MTDIKQFRFAAKSHRDAADAAERASSVAPLSTTYLRVVALECAAKALILKQAKAVSTAEFERKNKRRHDEIFRGTSGHDLRALEKHCELRRRAAENGKAFPDNAKWNEIAGNTNADPSRPYSLRYGTEVLSATDAKAQGEALNLLIEIVTQAASARDTNRKK